MKKRRRLIRGTPPSRSALAALSKLLVQEAVDDRRVAEPGQDLHRRADQPTLGGGLATEEIGERLRVPHEAALPPPANSARVAVEPQALARDDRRRVLAGRVEE